ncbi:beta-lactamase-like protein, partial [Cladochytrium replicatum]
MKSYLQLIGTPSGDAAVGVMAVFEGRRYLFNVGEGTQRLCIEQKVRLNKLSHVFFTRINWDCVGGVAGMMLSLSDAGNKSICLHGGRNLTHMLAAARHFVFKMLTQVDTNELNEANSQFCDDTLSVEAVIVYPSSSEGYDAAVSSAFGNKAPNGSAGRMQLEEALFLRSVPRLYNLFPNKSDTFYCALALPLAVLPVQENIYRARRNHNEVTRLPSTKRDLAVTSYICQGPTLKGKFFPHKAEPLEVNPGRDYGLLYNGTAIKTASGRVVLPHQVMGPDRPGSFFVIVDCPTEEYIYSLTKNDKFMPHYSWNTNNPIKVMVHLLGPRIELGNEYVNWMRAFGISTQHIIVSPKYNPRPIVFQGSAKALHRLSFLDSNVFKVPYYDNKGIDLSTVPGLPPSTLNGANMLIVEMDPKMKVERSEQKIDFDHNDPNGFVVEGLSKLETYLSLCEKTKPQIVDTLTVEEEVKSGDVRITTLGTGAALPSRYRNVSSTLISIPDKGHILLDAGEGTYGQLFRRFEDDPELSLEDIIMNLRMIFVSHMHADHHLGVSSILLYAEKGLELEPLHVVAPQLYRIWLEEYNECEDMNLERQVKFIVSDTLLWNRHHEAAYKSAMDEYVVQRFTLGLAIAGTVQVIHCPYAFALSLTHTDGWKIVFSGDCRPSQDLIQVGRNATVLIHEATFDSGMEHEAEDRRHSTTSEAVSVANRMQARYVLLTHFSQRYPKIPVFEDAVEQNAPDNEVPIVGIAFDLMSIKLKQLRRLPMFIPALKELYP